MQRTTVMLPAALKDKALRFARKKRVSLGELIRDSLASVLSRSPGDNKDPLFDDKVFFRGNIPGDLSKNHDKYLYESQ